ncbi:MAG: ABC transporter substrate-binding protein [Thermodesulfobacteriota bacterium]
MRGIFVSSRRLQWAGSARLIRAVLWLMVMISSAAASEPVTLALIVAETGLAVDDGTPARKGAEIALAEINQAGGLLGAPLRIIQLDNRSTPLGAKRAAEQAVDLGVQGVIGAIWSSHSAPMAAVLQAARIPMITPGSTKPEITLTGDYIFRACFLDSFQGRVMARFAFSDLGCPTAAVLKNINEEYSITLGEFFSAHFEKEGGEIVYEGNYQGVSVDFHDLLIETGVRRPHTIFIPGYSRDSGLLIKQARKMRIHAVFLGGDAWDGPIEDYAGTAVNGSYFSSHWHPEVDFPRSRGFMARYRKRFGDEPISSFAALTYDSVFLFAEAVRRAGSAETGRIRKALADTRDFKGVTGPISFNANGDPLDKKVSILKFENGSRHFMRSIGP